MLRILVIDDEKNAREAIISIINQSNPDVFVVGEAASVCEGLSCIHKYKPDLVLLDIELSDGNSFEILEKLDRINFKIIFITAHQEYALQAFKCSAIDYLVKPVHPQELLDAIQKTEEQIKRDHFQVQVSAFLEHIRSGKEIPEKIVLKTSENIYLIDVKEIIRCESDKNYTTFILIDKRKIVVSKTLKEFESILTHQYFFRPHQSHLINLNYFLRYNKTDGGYVVMTDNSIVPVSLRKKDILMQKLQEISS